MSTITWIAVGILGPGSILILLWFVADFIKILRKR